MNSDVQITEAEKHENVRERLNNLLHKKIFDQHEKQNIGTKLNEPQTQEIQMKSEETSFQQGDCSNEPIVEITENCEEDSGCTSEEDYNRYLLHEILNEKKKALLRNKDVINFLQSKLKWNES